MGHSVRCRTAGASHVPRLLTSRSRMRRQRVRAVKPSASERQP